MKKFLLLIWSLVILSCSTPFQIKGTYVNIDEPYKEIFFDQEQFVFRYNHQDTHPLYYCADTIAYGNWATVKNLQLLELNSEDSQSNSVTNVVVNEGKDGDVKKVSFFIKSPIEFHQKTSNSGDENVRAVEYGLEVRSNCIDFQGNLVSQRFHSNEFSILIPEGCDVTSFSIYIYPANFLRDWPEGRYPNVIHSLLYEIKDTGSNVFEIDLPKLTYCFMNALRLKQDYVHVESEDLLKWDGQLYKRKK